VRAGAGKAAGNRVALKGAAEKSQRSASCVAWMEQSSVCNVWVSPFRQTSDRKAGCLNWACPVWREGRGSNPRPYPYRQIWKSALRWRGCRAGPGWPSGDSASTRVQSNLNPALLRPNPGYSGLIRPMTKKINPRNRGTQLLKQYDQIALNRTKSHQI
jgi:hypothetical protein